MKEIFLEQKKIILKCVKYLNKLKKKNIDISQSPICYFTAWAETPGRYKLNEIAKNNLKKKFFILKNLYLISRNFDLKLFFNKSNFSIDKKIKKNLIISYCTKDNFDNNFNYKDTYFDLNNKNNTKFVWFLISLDNYIPKKISKNIYIIGKKNPKSFSFFYLIKTLIKIIIKNLISPKNLIHSIWYENNYSENIELLFHNFLKNVNIKNLIINYESIPFQNIIINNVKKVDNKIKVFAYLHCAPWPLQTDFFYKNQLIDKLVVSSFDQKKVFIKYFLWKEQKIEVIPSLRFKKNNFNLYKNSLFIPYNLRDSNVYLEKFELYLKKAPNHYLNKLFIKIHPLNRNSEIHKKFKIKLIKIIKKNIKKFSSKGKNFSFFFGSATGVCIQALEEGNNIIHFPENEKLDVFSQNIWKNINVKKIDNKTYSYSIKIKNRLFYVVNKKNRFNTFFLPLLKKYESKI